MAATPDMAADEAMANFLGLLASGEPVLERFIAQMEGNRGAMEKLRDAIHTLALKLKGVIGSADSKALARAELRLNEALRAAAGNKNAATEAGVEAVEALQDDADGGKMDKGKYSLKDYWHTDLTKAEMKQVQTFMKRDITRSTNSITETANWFMTRVNGQDVFGIYSTEVLSDPTLLYEAKGERAKLERDALINVMEEFENGSFLGAESLDSVLQAVWDGKDDRSRSASRPGYAGESGRNAGIYRRTSGRYPSAAFRNCVENLLKVEQRRLAEGGRGQRFSLKKPVEETEKLMALHNLTEAQLLGCLEMGGLPMPSIAVVKADQGHNQYGPISLVMDKAAIDPKASSLNKVYSGDAWTPTFPNVSYKLDGDKLRKFEADINALAESIADGIFVNSSFVRGMSAISTNGDFAKVTADVIAERLAENDTVRAAYLADKGETLTPELKTKQYGKFGNEVIQAYLDTMAPEELAELMSNIQMGGKTGVSAVEGQMEAIRKVVGDDYRQKHERFLSYKPDGTPLSEERIAKRVNDYLDRAVTYFAAEDFIMATWDYYSEGGAPTEVIDRMATHEKLAKAVDTKSVQAWVLERFDGILGKKGIYNGRDIFSPAGNRRSFEALHWDVTLENVVKAMRMAGEKNATAFAHGGGVGSLRSASSKTFKSIEDIRASSGQLQIISDEEYDGLMEQYGAEMRDIAETILEDQDTKPSMTFYAKDAIDTAMEEAATGPHTVQAISRTFAENDLKITERMAGRLAKLYKNLAEMPTGYFEAKPQRAVSFNEVLAAVIPDESGHELVRALETAGVNILTYVSGDEADRLEKVNSIEGGKFSLKDENGVSREAERLRKEGEAQGRSQEEIEAAVQQMVEETMTRMMEEYGIIKPGENPYREGKVPRKTSVSRKVSQTVRTILEAGATPDVAVPKLEELTASGEFSYGVYTDKEAMADAETAVRTDGYQEALKKWSTAVARGQVSKRNTALGWALYNAAANSNDIPAAMDILDLMVKHQRTAAQATGRPDIGAMDLTSSVR